MEHTTFGRTGLRVSRVAFGAGPIGYLGASEAQAGRILNLLLDRGVNVIDTAAAYLGSEELIGRTVGHRRKMARWVATSARSFGHRSEEL